MRILKRVLAAVVCLAALLPAVSTAHPADPWAVAPRPAFTPTDPGFWAPVSLTRIISLYGAEGLECSQFHGVTSACWQYGKELHKVTHPLEPIVPLGELYINIPTLHEAYEALLAPIR